MQLYTSSVLPKWTHYTLIACTYSSPPIPGWEPKKMKEVYKSAAEYIQHALESAQSELQDKAWISKTGNLQTHQPSLNLICKSLNRMNINKAVDVPRLLPTISDFAYAFFPQHFLDCRFLHLMMSITSSNIVTVIRSPSGLVTASSPSVAE